MLGTTRRLAVYMYGQPCDLRKSFRAEFYALEAESKTGSLPLGIHPCGEPLEG